MLTTVGCDRQGNQGVMDTASKGQLESEFGTSKDEECVKQILEKGSIVEKTVRIHALQPQELRYSPG